MEVFLASFPKETTLVEIIGWPKKNANCSQKMMELLLELCPEKAVKDATAHALRVGTCSALFTLG